MKHTKVRNVNENKSTNKLIVTRINKHVGHDFIYRDNNKNVVFFVKKK